MVASAVGSHRFRANGTLAYIGSSGYLVLPITMSHHLCFEMLSKSGKVAASQARIGYIASTLLKGV